MPTKNAIILLPHHIVILKTLRNILLGSVLIACALYAGMCGYHYTENMAWIDAFINASMILSGMGPVDPMHTETGKLFAGCYALFSGLFFILITGLIFAPLAAHVFKTWHLEMSNK